MGKQFIRIFSILLVASLISGGLYLFSQTNTAETLLPERGQHRSSAKLSVGADYEEHEDHTAYEDLGRGAWNTGAAGETQDGRGLGRLERLQEQRDTLSLTELLPGMVKHIGIVALVMLIVAGIQKGVGMLMRRRKTQQIAPSASSSPLQK
jgi:hypothetical protein